MQRPEREGAPSSGPPPLSLRTISAPGESLKVLEFGNERRRRGEENGRRREERNGERPLRSGTGVVRGALASSPAHTKRSMCLAPTRRRGRRYKSPFSSLKNPSASLTGAQVFRHKWLGLCRDGERCCVIHVCLVALCRSYTFITRGTS